MCHEDRLLQSWLTCMIWSYVSFTFVFERKSLEFGAYDIVHEASEMSFGWCYHHLSCCFGRMWRGWDAMSKGGMEIWSPTWEHPLGIRTMWSDMRCHSNRGCKVLCTEDTWKSYYKSSSLVHMTRMVENTLLVAEGICVLDLEVGHNILLVFGLIILWHPEMSLISVDLSVVYWSVLHLILDSTWVWYSLLLELKIPTLAWHWDFLLCLRHWEVYSLQVMRTQLETLGEEFKLAGNIWWREPVYQTLSLGPWDALALWGQWPHLLILFVWEFCDDDVSVLWGQYLHHRHRDLWDHTLDLMVCVLSFLEKTLVYIYSRPQWSKDIHCIWKLCVMWTDIVLTLSWNVWWWGYIVELIWKY